MDTVLVSHLRSVPQFRPLVMQRIFDAWATIDGFSWDDLDREMDRVLVAEGIPFTLVAHEGDRFLGTVSVIDDDLPVRPAIWPWLASLWVEPEARTRGIASLLIGEALARAAPFTARLHLHATPGVTPYYEARGWSPVERDVDGVNIFVRPTPEPSTQHEEPPGEAD